MNQINLVTYHKKKPKKPSNLSLLYQVTRYHSDLLILNKIVVVNPGTSVIPKLLEVYSWEISNVIFLILSYLVVRRKFNSTKVFSD